MKVRVHADHLLKRLGRMPSRTEKATGGAASGLLRRVVEALVGARQILHNTFQLYFHPVHPLPTAGTVPLKAIYQPGGPAGCQPEV